MRLGYNPVVSARGRLRSIMVFLVLLYLCSAGWFFIYVPWIHLWRSQVVLGAPWWAMAWLDHPALRGALSGFGVLHFIVALGLLSPKRQDS